MSDHNTSIDDDKINELREILDEDELQELIADFFDICSTDMENLNAAVNGNSVDNIYRISHGLKSSSGNLGFSKMSCLCRDLELQARNDEIVDADVQVQSILDEFNHLKNILT